jgi:amidase
MFRRFQVRDEEGLQSLARVIGSDRACKIADRAQKWNEDHRAQGAVKYAQAQLDNSDEMDLEADSARYIEDRQKDLRLSAAEGIDAVMKNERLDALLFPSWRGAAIAAKPGYPTVIVPFGFTTPRAEVEWPAGFVPAPAPFGVSFTGMACSEPRLIELAYAFERATHRRVPPQLKGSDP